MAIDSKFDNTPVSDGRFLVTDKKWLQDEKNLLGKTLKVVRRGKKEKKEDGHDLVVFPDTEYVIHITKVEQDPCKAVDYIYGRRSIDVDYAPAPDWDMGGTPSLSELECIVIDNFHPGRFEENEYWILPEYAAIEEIKQ